MISTKHESFIYHYMMTMDHLASAEYAGFKRKFGAILLKSPLVKEEIRRRMVERSDNTGINTAWVLRKLALLVDFNIRSFITVDDQGNAIYDFSKATLDDWYCISEYAANVSRANDKVSVQNIRIKSFDKLKALGLIGKHVDVQAFKENVEISGDSDMVSRIKAGRKRIS